MICGSITQSWRNKAEALTEQERYTKEPSKTFLLFLKRNIGRDIFICGLTMLFLRSFKLKILKELKLYMRK